MTKLSTVLDQVDNGTMLLPEFQRGYVWNRDQVRGLMKSVYQRLPRGCAPRLGDRDSRRSDPRRDPLAAVPARSTCSSTASSG